MEYIVYMLRCSDSTIYTGMTNNLSRRIEMHNSRKGAKYTRSRTPVTVIYTEQMQDRSSALKREAEIKRLTRAEKEKLAGIRINLDKAEKLL